MKFKKRIGKHPFSPFLVLLLALLLCFGWYLSGKKGTGYTVRTQHPASQSQVYTGNAD